MKFLAAVAAADRLAVTRLAVTAPSPGSRRASAGRCPNFRTPPFHTKDFGTEVAYFRVKQNRLEHIFGAHYDMDESDYRHPVFHAQLASRTKSEKHVRVLFSQDREVTDNMKKSFVRFEFHRANGHFLCNDPNLCRPPDRSKSRSGYYICV